MAQHQSKSSKSVRKQNLGVTSRAFATYVKSTNTSNPSKQECTCDCQSCNCRGSSDCSINGSTNHSITQFVVNATAAMDINRVQSNESSYTNDSIYQYGDSFQYRRVIHGPSLEYLSRSPAHRDEKQMKFETLQSFLEDSEDFNSHILIDHTMYEAHGEFFDFAGDMDMNDSVEGGRHNSVDLLSEYSAAFTTQGMSQSAILAQVGTGPMCGNGNKFLELTERRQPRFQSRRP